MQNLELMKGVRLFSIVGCLASLMAVCLTNLLSIQYHTRIHPDWTFETLQGIDLANAFFWILSFATGIGAIALDLKLRRMEKKRKHDAANLSQ